jgi:sortase A
MWKRSRTARSDSADLNQGGPNSYNWWAVWKWVESALFTAELGLLAIYCAVRLESFLSSRAAMKSFADLESSTSPVAKSDEGDSGSQQPDFSSWDQNRVHSYKESQSKQFDAPMAVLQIPKIHLAVPLLDGTDDLTLNHAVGHIAGTAWPGEEGNIGIAGHRDGFFRGLKDVKLGDEIELRTLKGTDRYIVDQFRIVTPDNVDVLRPRPDPSLTLVTCYPFYFIGSAPKRYVVMASLMHEKSSGSGSTMPGSESQNKNTHMEKTMISLNAIQRLSVRRPALIAFLAMTSLGASAQDTTTTSLRHGEPAFESNVRNAEIAYVEGNDLVLKLENGKVEHLIVPSSEKFTIDGQEATVNELKAGTKLTQTITTTTTPRYVKTIRVLKGKVWHVNAPGSVILTLPDGTNQLYKVPSHATFTINGQKKTVFDLKKGMKLEATIVTDEPQTVVAYNKTNVGQAPTPATPPLLGVLLIQRTAPATQEVARAEEVPSSVSAEHVDTLPSTSSNLPLVGLLGLFGLGSAVGLGTIRKLANAKA